MTTEEEFEAIAGKIHTQLNDPRRLRALQESCMLDTKPEDAFDRLAVAASKLLGTPLAMISFVDTDRDFIKAQVGLPEPFASRREIDVAPSFCQLTVTQNEPLIINDATTVPTLRLFPSVSKMGVRAHLGIPLTFQGQPIGNCCVIDFQPRNWTKQDVEQLTQLAEAAMDQIALEIAAQSDSTPGKA